MGTPAGDLEHESSGQTRRDHKKSEVDPFQPGPELLSPGNALPTGLQDQVSRDDCPDQSEGMKARRSGQAVKFFYGHNAECCTKQAEQQAPGPHWSPIQPVIIKIPLFQVVAKNDQAYPGQAQGESRYESKSQHLT